MDTWPPLKAKPIDMKNILSSKTLWGAVISLVSRFTQSHLDQDESTWLAENSFAMWPLILGILADFRVAIVRIKAVNFNIAYFKSPIFRTAVFGFIMVVLQGLGVNWEGLETLPQKLEAFISLAGSVGGFILVLVGRAKAYKELRLP